MSGAAEGTDVWVLPDEPTPVRLMNTIWADRSGVHDALSTVEAATAWLRLTVPHTSGLDATPGDLLTTRRLRDALRRLAAIRTNDERHAAQSPLEDAHQAVAIINEIARAVPHSPRLELRDGQLINDPSPLGPPVATALADLAREGINLFTNPDAPGLRACLAPGCVLYFVKDHPRREWCSATCGNRARVSRHYQKHHPAVADSQQRKEMG